MIRKLFYSVLSLLFLSLVVSGQAGADSGSATGKTIGMTAGIAGATGLIASAYIADRAAKDLVAPGSVRNPKLLKRAEKAGKAFGAVILANAGVAIVDSVAAASDVPHSRNGFVADQVGKVVDKAAALFNRPPVAAPVLNGPSAASPVMGAH